MCMSIVDAIHSFFEINSREANDGKNIALKI